MNRREGFSAMKAKFIVLPKRDQTTTVKKRLNFLGLSVRENPDKTRLTSSFSDAL